METWKDVPIDGFEHYQVSSSGRVRNTAREFRVLTERSLNNKGYRIQTLVSQSGFRKTFSVHTLVALAFIGMRPAGYEVCHNDNNKSNNHFRNLRYDTPAKNKLDWINAGSPNKRKYGIGYHKKIDLEQRHILKHYLIERAKDMMSRGVFMRDAAMQIGLSESALCRYVNGSRGKRLDRIKEMYY